MTHASTARAWSPGKITTVAILAIIAVLAIIAGIIYLTEPAKSLPSVLGTITSPASRANAHRSTRGAVALIVGVIFLAAAWFASRAGRSSARSG
jgi:amino acid permease